MPFLFIILVAARFFGGGDPLLLLLIFGLLSWAGLARLVRALFLSLREQEYVHGGHGRSGVSNQRIAFRHMLPNALGPIIVSATLHRGQRDRPRGVRELPELRRHGPPTSSWGTALVELAGYLVLGNWWWAFFPGMAIALTVIGDQLHG